MKAFFDVNSSQLFAALLLSHVTVALKTEARTWGLWDGL